MRGSGSLKTRSARTETYQVEILCHRGWWAVPEERNSTEALQRAFAAGHGVETDLRDLAGRIVVSHDPPGPDPDAGLPDLVDLLRLFDQRADPGPTSRMALNIKADGLAVKVAQALGEFGIDMSAEACPVYAFDASIPDQLAWIRVGVPTFTRHSEVEPEPVLYHEARGVWLDCFGPGLWWSAETIARHLDAGKHVAVVSPELHGRDHRPAWEMLHDPILHGAQHLALCTDLPGDAVVSFA